MSSLTAIPPTPLSPSSVKLPDAVPGDVDRSPGVPTTASNDAEGDLSWRSRGSDETDASHATQASARTDGTSASALSTSESLDSMGSQDVEVITSPIQGASPPQPPRSYLRSTPSPYGTSQYSYPDSYSESNPYAFPYPSHVAPTLSKDSTHFLSSNNASDSARTFDDFASNAAIDSTSAKQDEPHLASTSATSHNSVFTLDPDSPPNYIVTNALPKPNTASSSISASTPHVSLALPRRENASIPIINPVDRSVVRTPMPVKASLSTSATPPPTCDSGSHVEPDIIPSADTHTAKFPALSVSTQISDDDLAGPDLGDKTVVPSPSPTPVTAPAAAARPEDVCEVLYCAKPPIVLPAPGVLGKGEVTLGQNGTINGFPISPCSMPTELPTSTSSAATSVKSSAFKSPNVYINGLPPYYPEDELLALTSPFGGVRSVRSFTRHLGSDDDSMKKASGYGFVLFEGIEAAERCIEGLRQYRNLHPSFSKQAHKIPGTPYTNMCTSPSPSFSASEANAMPSSASEASVVGSVGANSSEDRESFKARMERLGDRGSTNLYIEGLPLSIDENALAALVSPYAIKSSRFFQTKLSHPPRIISFVRLETRQAAEDIIERLHGRLVRGWNDTGCRISVRFADTTEQRELRRNERASREDDRPSDNSARLTIAQAALLNLHGQELRNQARLEHILDHNTASSTTPLADLPVIGGFTSPVLGHQRSLQPGPLSGIPASVAQARLSRMAGNGFASDFNRSSFPYNHGSSIEGLASASGNYSARDVVETDASAQYGVDQYRLQQNQQRQRTNQGRQGDMRYKRPGSDQFPSNSRRLPGLQSNASHTGRYPTIGGGSMGGGLGGADVGFNDLTAMGIGFDRLGSTQAYGGYTPAEELILRAHQSKPTNTRLQAQPLSQSQSRPLTNKSYRTGKLQRGLLEDTRLGGKSHRSGSSALGFSQQRDDCGMNEEDAFHATASGHHHQLSLDKDNVSAQQWAQDLQANIASPGLSSYTFAQAQRPPPDQNTHTRSTTVPYPQRSAMASGAQQQRHYQHSSISIPHPSLTTTASGYTHTQSINDTPYDNRPTAQSTSHRSTKYSSGDSSAHTPRDHGSSGVSRDGKSSTGNHVHAATLGMNINNYEGPAANGGQQNDAEAYDGDVESPMKKGIHRATRTSTRDHGSPDPIVSPALTYSSQTPSTLSPSTPYFGSFGNPQVHNEGDRGVDMDRNQGKVVELAAAVPPTGMTVGKKARGDGNGGGKATMVKKGVKTGHR
ncbi:hypothetical protein HGRIS_000640 [Hohenbuehelia grisea]|uniref:RRM domain-containing protein n=1 Tax=Hohenbuehelia grisea TaxID=104357 RepID=A0ABR3JRU1_9AGAR